ncbi:MAG: 2-amino-4-hydroxy-6-hydroxymethyldihydropteridine diphosphokinase [Gemmobacter sp.]
MTVLVALGANLPHDGRTPAQTLTAAIAALPGEGLAVARASRLYATPCFPAGAGPDYVNAAISLRVDPGMTARDVLAALHRVEARFGRARMDRWGMRTLDLDLLAMGQTVLPDAQTAAHWRDLPPVQQIAITPDRLILPHPRLQDRAFVLVPLADVTPRWRHPTLGLTVAQMLRRLPAADRGGVKPLGV